MQLIKHRQNLHKLATETGDRHDWIKFKQVNGRLKFEEKMRLDDQLSKCGTNSSQSWKCVKNILNWQNSGSPKKLFYKGAMRTKLLDIANSQNEFFIEKIASIRSNLPLPNGDPLATLKASLGNKECSFSLMPVSPDQVYETLSSLKNTNAYGLDMIDTYAIKLVKDEILPAVTHIVNLSITTQKFPVEWKKSKVIPLHKKDDVLDPKNYRPVAIVPVLSKILEKLVFSQILGFMDQNNLINPNHHAYRPGHNTTSAMISMYDTWISMIEAGQLGGICMLDMSAAFDVVDHQILLKKLALYGFDEDSLNWIQNYLNGRSQCVMIEGVLSNFLHCDVGVPQGSILGPLFYTLYTNELPDVIHSNVTQRTNLGDEQVCCYADDTTLSCSDSDPVGLSQKLEVKFRLLSDFMLNNRLKLNDTKTQLLVIIPGQRNNENIAESVTINTSSGPILPCTSAKLLGCWISGDLKWTEHIRNNRDNLLMVLNQRAAAVRKISKVSDFRTRKMIAEGIYISKLSYLIALWGGCGNGLKKALQITQNKVARIVTKLPWTTTTSVLLHQCGWLSVNQMVFYHSVLLLFKVKLQGYPEHLLDMHKENEYAYRTRQADSNILKVKKARLEVSKSGYRWRAADHFNRIPKEIRDEKCVRIFKCKVKTWIMSNVPVWS